MAIHCVSNTKKKDFLLVVTCSLTNRLYSEGVVTIGCGMIFAFMMPEFPHNARLLKPVERDFAVWRLKKEAGDGEADEDSTTLGGFKQAFLDPKIWALVWCMGMAQAMGSTVNFFPSIVETLGYNRINTMLLTAPPFILAAIVFYTISYISDVSCIIYRSAIPLGRHPANLVGPISAKMPCIR
jgi:hypothetical protein